MRILFLGDVVGRAARVAVMEQVPRLRQRLDLDFVVVNGENSAGGFGITPKIAEEFYESGVDCLTTGNHVWDQRELLGTIDRDSRMVRPANFPAGTPGRGATLLQARGGRQVLVVNIMARLFMDALDDPFAAVDKLLADMAMPGVVDAIIVDFHGEASSEKMAMGHHLDGRVTLVVGTHTHIPTADLHILRGGTAYQTDAGMCGDYDSVIGMVKEPAIARFIRKMPTERLSPAEGQPTICGLVLETDETTGLVRRVEPLRIGGRLAPAWPSGFGAAESPA
ncbi:MAG: YmdB family metallophosphoesterase [Inquilinus limosus]|uniref:YmdB family metallophosphoesterase n=1 Tax=Inquilinus limosus TaxID=171674 RepID=A0A952FN36_9PROT|nr:YmdB family metallophosphoesterase [Inquilinus limosus]